MCSRDLDDRVFVSTPTTYRSSTGARPITNMDLSNRTSVSGILEERFKENLPLLTSSSPKQNLSLRYSVLTMESWVVNNARFMGGYSVVLAVDMLEVGWKSEIMSRVKEKGHANDHCNSK